MSIKSFVFNGRSYQQWKRDVYDHVDNQGGIMPSQLGMPYVEQMIVDGLAETFQTGSAAFPQWQRLTQAGIAEKHNQ